MRTASAISALSILFVLSAGCGSDVHPDVSDSSFDIRSDILFDVNSMTDSHVSLTDVSRDYSQDDFQLDSVLDPGNDATDPGLDSVFVDVNGAFGDSVDDDLGSVQKPWFSCEECEADDECADGWACRLVRVDKYCVQPCTDNGDCEPGFECESFNESGYCIPVTQNCVSCMGDRPCGPGKCCDFITAACVLCKGECAPCEYDFDCPGRYRCFKTSNYALGVCVPECVDGTCDNAEKFACVEMDDGVDVCQPLVERCGGCYGDKPFLVDGKCSECRNDEDCPLNSLCIQGLGKCQTVACPGGLFRCADDKQCHECCGISWQCAFKFGDDSVCLEDRTCYTEDPCRGSCTNDFPICTLIDGVGQCVQCATDADCQMAGSDCHCQGDPIFSCVDSDGCICGHC